MEPITSEDMELSKLYIDYVTNLKLPFSKDGTNSYVNDSISRNLFIAGVKLGKELMAKELEKKMLKMRTCCLCVHCDKDCDASGCNDPCDRWELALD